jgi:hypothetical protein
MERIEVEVSEVLSRTTPRSVRRDNESASGMGRLTAGSSALLGVGASAVASAAASTAPPVQHSNLSEFGLPLAARKVYFGRGDPAISSAAQVPSPPCPVSTGLRTATVATETTNNRLNTEDTVKEREREQQQQQQRSGGGSSSLRNRLPRLIPPKDLVDEVKEYKKQLKM